MRNTTAQDEAYSRGRAAAAEGKSIVDNPYDAARSPTVRLPQPLADELRDEWNAGLLLAHVPRRRGWLERHGHDFVCVGGAAGWEVWECTRCKRETMPGPIPFLPLWPEIAGTFFRRWRCSRG